LRRYFVKVSGIVQQVGFRYFVYEAAIRLNLTGIVYNCEDETVEIEVQGEEEILSRFLDKVREGSRFSKVEEVIYKEIDIKSEEKKFSVIV
jgi:acylphosphatase